MAKAKKIRSLKDLPKTIYLQLKIFAEANQLDLADIKHGTLNPPTLKIILNNGVVIYGRLKEEWDWRLK